MLLTIQSTLIIPHLCSSPWSQFQFFIFFLSGEFPSQVSQSHLQTENKTLIWLFSDVTSIGLQQKVILQDVMLYAFCSFKNHKPVCLKICLFPKPSAAPTEHTCENGFRLIYRHACSRKQQTLTSQIYCEWKQKAGKKARVKSGKLCLAGNCVLNTLKMGSFSSLYSLRYVVGDQGAYTE